MSHFKSRLTSPHIVIGAAYTYVVIIVCVLYGTGFYKDSTFFNWGTPIRFFNHEITSDTTFYTLLLMIFFHQIINNWVSTVVYPWIINSIQDHKNKEMEYSRVTSLLIVNLFNIYSEIDVVFIVAGFMSQISFVLVVMCANVITSTFINNRYLREKQRTPLGDWSQLNSL
jgi:hypothetical protein